MSISKDQYQLIVEALIPIFDNVKTKRIIVEEAFFNQKLLTEIDMDGNTQIFTRTLVIQLINYGQLENGVSALSTLLKTALKHSPPYHKPKLEEVIRSLYNRTKKFASEPVTPNQYMDPTKTIKGDFPDITILELEVKSAEKYFSISFQESREAVVGRSDPETGYAPDIDLISYDTELRVVSRRHAKIIKTRSNIVIIKDMHSTNGTRINGISLRPGTAYGLRNRDYIRIGNIIMQVRLLNL